MSEPKVFTVTEAYDLAISAVREFAHELGIHHDPSFTPEADRYADWLRSVAALRLAALPSSPPAQDRND